MRHRRKTKKLTLFYQIILRFKLEALYSLVLITHFASDLRSHDFNPRSRACDPLASYAGIFWGAGIGLCENGEFRV